MLKNSLRAIALLSAAAPAIAASNFDYISGGYHYQNNKNVINKLHKNTIDKKIIPNANTHGAYLEVNKDLYKGIFVSARGALASGSNNYTAGVGYHYPVSSSVDIYGLVGFSGSSLLTDKQATRSNTITAPGTIITSSQKSDWLTVLKPAPTLELGVKAAVNEKMGVSTAVSFSSHKAVWDHGFGKENHKEKVPRIEGRLTGYYNLSDKMAVEVGYTYTHLKNKNVNPSAKYSQHGANLGVRYFF